ncbi:NAD(P)H dehydrogenase (quinone) [Breznakibacter xylanolyticus]|uniref:NAD(P)H dehydrogenase (Quinone) n=1 Tax=Breznakibacter xylanolyticus TaxID=990 RepID=A0A2W7MV91_9BACT|nr:SDR family oxidoreductase [Breznakibacter xylanolyticus]PZX11750.1 NAD(P)H dehydrogenase (quinone) [Breznakibacter xylanolyticus]
MKIGVTGATGQLGRLVVQSLKDKVAADNIVALVRTPEKATELGVDVCAFDYSQTENLVASLQGIDKLLLISGNEIGQRLPQHKAVIAAAKQAGVQHIVYTSILHADNSPLSLAIEHLGTEAVLKESGMTYTILRNGWYTENYTGSAKGAIGAGAFIGNAGDGKISSAARADYAEAAAVVLASTGHEGKTYELAGDEVYTLAELAAEISSQSGKNIPYNNLTETQYADILKSFGLPDGLAQMLADSDTGASKGGLFDNSRTLSTLIGRPTTPLAKVVADALV